MSDDSPTEPWEAFWLASELSRSTAVPFAAAIGDFAPRGVDDAWAYSAAPVPLVRPGTATGALVAQRRSTRRFGSVAMRERQLAQLFESLADVRAHNVTRRAWPSAGALYPVQVFALMLDVAHELDRWIVHYEPDLHALTPVAQLTHDWPSLVDVLGAQALESAPQLVMLLVLDTAGAEEKYGNRAGRFALIEIGHVAQNLALGLAEAGLCGCELGGGLDRDVLGLLDVEPSAARFALAYAIGTLPEEAR